MTLNNKVYDILKWITMIVLPALATLYGVVGKLWNLPYVTEITGTITALATFFGTCLCISNYNYNKAK
mgnify:CR=1 FL=1